MSLPPFPVDDGTLDLLWSALGHEPNAQRTSVSEFLELMSQLGGSDTTAVESVEDGIHLMRDPQYHVNDALAALVVEIRRLRSADTNQEKP